MLQITDTLAIDFQALEFSAVRSSGPGGQHVNTTSSAVQLRFDAQQCAEIGPAMLQRLRRLAGQRMTQEGVIVIQAQEARSQHQNRAIAVERLRELLVKASVVPKKRIKTKPSKAAVKRRLESKNQRSKLKQQRGPVRRDD